MDEQGQKDNFKWFGEGFDGFPKRLPEDCVEYVICVIDQRLKDEAALRSRLREIQNAANDLTKKLLKDYIWQREKFKLELERANDSVPNKNSRKDESEIPLPLAYTLRGRTSFGDSIADEWLILYLLRELGKQFSDAWIRVADSDGEFLLIEAASSLPKWLNPEVAENRVWINNGELKIIPAEAQSKPKDKTTAPRPLSLKEAVSFITTTPSDLLHSPQIQKEAFQRLQDYPAAISTSLHHAIINIPRRLAYVLHQNPSYISPAVESFYLRDPISTKPLNTKDTATLFFPPEGFVTVSIRFTRVGYAQLHAQEYPPPPSWTAIRPHMNEPRVSIGMKLSCGFEMLLQDKQNQDKQAVREIKILIADIEDGEDSLPTDVEVKKWPLVQDDEKWLDIDFADFEKELASKGDPDATKSDNKSGNASAKTTNAAGADPSAQENLRKIVNRFEDFLSDDKAGLDGAEVDSDDDDDDDPSTSSSDNDNDNDSDNNSDLDSQGEDKSASFDEAEFETAMREMMGMPAERIEASGLLDEARKLALEMEDEEEAERDEEEETRLVMEMMERELKGKGALILDPDAGRREEILKGTSKAKGKADWKGNGKGKAEVQEDLGELSSEDEDEGGDVDVEMLRNMLESFKGQAGMGGPASSMMAAMGVKMPRDDGEDEDEDD